MTQPVEGDDDLFALLETVGPNAAGTGDFFSGSDLPWAGAPQYRREAFMRTVREFWHAYEYVQAAYMQGPHLVISLAYFVIFHLLTYLNRRRGGYLDVHEITVLILNSGASGDFGPLFDYIFN